MKYRHSMTLATASFGVAAALACGPFFPENALDQPKGILQPPLFHFQSELNSLPMPEGISKHAPGTPAFTLDLEMAEIADIVGLRMPERSEWMERYRSLRRSMIFYGDDSAQRMQKADADIVELWTKMRRDFADIIAPLPIDVKLYLEGAAAWLDARDSADENASGKARDICFRRIPAAYLQLLRETPGGEESRESITRNVLLDWSRESRDDARRWLNSAEASWISPEALKSCLRQVEMPPSLGGSGSQTIQGRRVWFSY